MHCHHGIAGASDVSFLPRLALQPSDIKAWKSNPQLRELMASRRALALPRFQTIALLLFGVAACPIRYQNHDTVIRPPSGDQLFLPTVPATAGTSSSESSPSC